MSSFAQLEEFHATGNTQGGRALEVDEKVVEANKKAKLSARLADIPSSIIAVFANQEGQRAGPQIDLPTTSSAKQLELIVNSVLENEQNIPYAFYINGVEVIGSLQEALEQYEKERQQLKDEGKESEEISYEDTLQISYQPLSVFRVRPVTRCIETLPGHTDAVLHLSFSADGRKLASGGGDMAVRFWNTTTNLPSHVCLGHRHHVLCTCWSPDHGSLFVSADHAGEIRMWDPVTGTQVGKVLKGHTKWVTSLCFEPLHMTGQITRFASSSKDHSVKVWNVRTGLCETTICGHNDSIEVVKWGGTGLLYTGSRDRTIKVWAIDGDGVQGSSRHKLIRTLTGHAHRINTMALNCDYVLRTGALSLDSMKAAPTQTPMYVPKKNRKGADGEAISEGGDGGEGDKKSVSAAIAASNALAVVSEEVRAVRQAAALERYQSVVGIGGPDSVGERLVSGSDDFTLFLWAPQEDKKPILRMTGHQQMINHVLFSPDARYFASASFDKKIKIWDGKTGKFLHTCTGHVGSVYQVCWSADSNYLVSASKDSTLKLWNVKGGDLKKSMHTLPGHEDEVYALDWSPDGSSVASGSKDRTIKIWHH